MTTLRPLKICIYGAGAVGGTIGVLLAQSRHDRLFVQCVY
ncbi:2-dehydropantoate 2-reductase N-terminal domain-containing protein [Phyllobacterium bourgognense]